MRNPSLDDRVRRTGIDQGLREDAVDQHSNEKEVVARAGEPAGPTGQTGRGRETGPSRPSGWVRVRVRGRVRVRVRGTRPAGLERVRATRPSVRVRVGVRIRMRVRVWGTRVGRPLPHRQTGTPHRCEEQKSDFGRGRAQTRRKRKMTGTRTAQTRKKRMLLQGCGDRLENPNDVAPRSTSRSKRILTMVIHAVHNSKMQSLIFKLQK